jgi:hypothetical protein
LKQIIEQNHRKGLHASNVEDDDHQAEDGTLPIEEDGDQNFADLPPRVEIDNNAAVWEDREAEEGYEEYENDLSLAEAQLVAAVEMEAHSAYDVDENARRTEDHDATGPAMASETLTLEPAACTSNTYAQDANEDEQNIEEQLDMFDEAGVWPSTARDSLRPGDIHGQQRINGVEGDLGFFNLRVTVLLCQFRAKHIAHQ